MMLLRSQALSAYNRHGDWPPLGWETPLVWAWRLSQNWRCRAYVAPVLDEALHSALPANQAMRFNIRKIGTPLAFTSGRLDQRETQEESP